MPVLTEVKEGIGSLGTEVMDGWEQPFGYWELNSHLPLEEQSVFLTSELSSWT